MNGKTAIMIIVLVAGVGIGGFVFGQKYKIVPQEQAIVPTPTQQMVGNDTDEHGCLGSGGYSWCEIKKKCLRVWEEPCEVPSKAPVSPTSMVDETETIRAAIKQALVAKHGSDPNTLNVTVSKILGNNAQGGAKEAEAVGGGMWLAAKVGGIWKLIWDGNGTISCATIEPYNFPVSMVPECWNEATGKSVTR